MEPKPRINKDGPSREYHAREAERERIAVEKNIGHESGAKVVPVGEDHDPAIRRELKQQ